MKGAFEFKIIERPEDLDLNINKSKNKSFYTKVLTSLDNMSSTKCIVIGLEECPVKVPNLRLALNRNLRKLKKDYTAFVSIDKEKGIVYIWRHHRFNKEK